MFLNLDHHAILLNFPVVRFKQCSLLFPGYSGSDMKNLVKDASMGPLREALQQGVEITKLNKEEVRPVMLKVTSHIVFEFRQ